MHILFAMHGYKPAYRLGGPILAVPALAEKLVAKGHRVTVFATNVNLDEDLDVPLDTPLDVDGVQVWYFGRREPIKRWLRFIPYVAQSIGWLYAPRMYTALEQVVPGVDVVHTHIPFIYPTYAAARAATRWGKPLFYQHSGILNPGMLQFRYLKKRVYLAAIERPILRSATTLIAHTPVDVASYRAQGIGTVCRVIPNGIAADAYRLEPRPGTDARWGIPEGALVILFLARLHPTKRADVLIRAFLEIQARCPRASLIVAGPDEHQLVPAYRSTIEAAGLGHRVSFPGMVLGEDKLDLLARADLFVLPSLGEGLSLAVLEALASATAVLLSPECNFPEVEAAAAGRIAAGDATSMASAMADLLSDPDRLRAMGRAGLELVRRSYSWDQIADQYLEAYEEGIGRSRSHRLVELRGGP